MTDWTKYGQTETKEPTPPALRPVDDAPKPAVDDSAPVAQDWTRFAVPDSDDDSEVERYFTETDHDDDQNAKSARSEKKSELRTAVAIVAALLVLLAIAMFVGWSVMRSMVNGGDTQAVESAPTTAETRAEQAATSQAEQPAAPVSKERTFGACETSGQQVEADQSTSYGAIAAFQQAYYDHDVDGVRQVLAPNAPLQKQNWDKVFSSLEDNMSFCVTMQPATAQGTKIPTTLTVGNKTYEQSVSVVNNGGTWFIQEIKKA